MANENGPIGGFAAFGGKYSKIVTSVLGVIVFTAIFIGLYLYLFSPIATVNGEQITKNQFTKETENYNKMAAFMGNSDYSKFSTIRDSLVERKLIDIAASKYGISVSEEDIAEEVKSQEDSFKNDKVDYKDAYATAYGLDGDELTTVLKYKLLKERLVDKVIKRKEGRLIYARFNPNNGVEQLLGVKAADLDSNAKSIITKWKSELDTGVSFDELYNQIQKDNKYPAYYGDTFTYDIQRDKVPGEDEAILATSVGEYSDIAKTKTYYAIYFIDQGSNGEYDKWEDFIKDYSAKYVKYPLISYKKSSAIKVGINAVKSEMQILAHELFGLNIAFAGCDDCAGCTGAKVKGTVKDTLGNALSGVSMSGTSNSSDFCSGSTSSSKVAYCGYRTDSDSTSSTGGYSMGNNDGKSCRFNCAGGTVAVKASVSKYTDDTKTVTVTNGSTKDVDFELTPASYTLTVIVKGTGTGPVKSPSGGIVCKKGDSSTSDGCTAKYTYNIASDNVYTTLTAYPDSGSVFVSWSGGGCSGNGTCQPNVDNNVTVTATIDLASYTITPYAETGCSFVSNTNAAESVSYGGSSSWYWGQSDAGHKFMGFSVDGGPIVAGNVAGQSTVYQFTSVITSHTLLIKCTPITYGVTVSKAGTGTGSISLSTGTLISGSLTGSTFPRSGVVGHGTTLGISAIPNATSRASWSGNCSGSSTVAGATVVTSLANIIANKTCVITFDLVGTVSPVVELISPSPTENPVDTNGAVILATNYTKLEARLRIPGYVSASGGTAKLGITYAENKVGGIAKTVQGSVTGLSSEGAISLIVDASDLVAGQVYIWDAFGQVVDGSPQGTNGFSVSKDEVESAEQWKFIYRVGGTEGGGGGEVENFSCKVVPSSGTTGLPVGISINGAPVETTTYVVTTGDGNTFDVLGKDLPYYYSYDTVGSYTVGVALKTGTASGLPCSTTIQVNAGTDGGGGSEVLTNQN